jgi:hypothetical protein
MDPKDTKVNTENPRCIPDEQMEPEEKIIRGDDIVFMLQDFWKKIHDKFAGFQLLSQRKHRMSDNGRIIAVMDRYVDIDPEALARIPWHKENDHLIVMVDETHAGESSVYRIYNTSSIPNVKYIGFAEPEAYPTVTAVEHYVSKAVAAAEYNLMQEIKSLKNRLDALEQ